MAKRVDESRASELVGTYDNGEPRPTGYGLGVQTARRDALIYGAFSLTRFEPACNEYQSAYNDALDDIKDAIADDAGKRLRRRAGVA